MKVSFLHCTKLRLHSTKSIKLAWPVDCQQYFEKIKASLSSNLLLTYFDPTQKIIATDASSRDVGAVISLIFADKSKKAIMHAVRSLTPAERNYSQVEKEALGLIFAAKKFHKMLFGRRFTLLTDHNPLLSIFGLKKGIPIYSTSRLKRWAIILLGYEFDIQYCKTTEFC